MIRTLKAQEVKQKLDKLDLIKIQNFKLQDTIKKVKRQAVDWKKVFANHI